MGLPLLQGYSYSYGDFIQISKRKREALTCDRYSYSYDCSDFIQMFKRKKKSLDLRPFTVTLLFRYQKTTIAIPVTIPHTHTPTHTHTHTNEFNTHTHTHTNTNLACILCVHTCSNSTVLPRRHEIMYVMH